MADRYFPMNWAPRWVEAHYETSSNLRGLYYYSTRYHNDLLMRLTQNNIPQFYGEVFEPSHIFVANYHSANQNLPQITLTASGTSSLIIQADTIGSFNYEQIRPIVFKDNDRIIFKNLNTISCTALITSGYLNLSTQLSNKPPEIDSPFYFVNQYNDLTIIDQVSTVYLPVSGEFLLPFDGLYTIYYRSQTTLNRLVSGLDFVSIDNRSLRISRQLHKNSWDNFGDWHGLDRHCFESNTLMKLKNQHLTIAQKPNQRLASMLGTTIGITWNSSAILNTSASSIKDWQFQNYERWSYFTEQPTLQGSTLLLSYPPSGALAIMINNKVIPENSYVVSGSYILPTSLIFNNLKESEITVTYKIARMAPRFTSNSLESMLPDKEQYRGILITKVLTDTVTKKVTPKEWKWDRPLNIETGLATFDF